MLVLVTKSVQIKIYNMKIIPKLFVRLLNSRLMCQRYTTSALFVTGEKANKVTAVVTPHLDFEDRFQEIEKLKENVEMRQLKLDVHQIRDLWEMLKSVEENKIRLEKKRMEIVDSIQKLKQENNDEEVEKLKLKGKLLREDFKTVMRMLWAMQEKTVVKALSLPNDLHPETPATTEKVLFSFNSVPQNYECHTEVGLKHGLLKYFSPMCYYLEGDAAYYELKILNYFSDILKENMFVPTSNSDFVCSVVIEGCGLQQYNPHSVLTLDDHGDSELAETNNRIHLVGGASLPSFCAYHAKNIVTSKLPVRYFTTGWQFNPPFQKFEGLFNVCQTSAIEIFVLTSDSESELEMEFSKTLGIITEIYKEMGYHFRITYVPARMLKSCESLKASVQMFSSHLGSYVEVGNLSVCNSYISKRLLMYYKLKQDHKFVKVLSGTVLSVPKLLGCILEYKGSLDSGKHLVMPSVLSKY